jgi:hypothetical protein
MAVSRFLTISAATEASAFDVPDLFHLNWSVNDAVDYNKQF